MKDIFIALMGVTGAGKSTFISHCCDSKDVEIGDGLKSCTKDVKVHKFAYNASCNIHLVDTPGFDDTHLKDTEVLRQLATWLTQSYQEKTWLSGIIYLHRISDVRMQGTAKQNLGSFIKLCGAKNLKNVVLATTMWEMVDEQVGDNREKELVGNPDFWGYMTSKGSKVYRHHNSRESAMSILGRFVPLEETTQPAVMVLEIQEEMAEKSQTLDQTGAGTILADRNEKETNELVHELEELKTMLKASHEERDQETAKLLRDQENELKKTVKRLAEEYRRLHVSTEQLHAEKIQNMQQHMDAQKAATDRLAKRFEEIQLRGPEAASDSAPLTGAQETNDRDWPDIDSNKAEFEVYGSEERSELSQAVSAEDPDTVLFGSSDLLFKMPGLISQCNHDLLFYTYVVFSPNSRWLAAAAARTSYDPAEKIDIWEVQNDGKQFAMIQSLETGFDLMQMTFSSDGNWFASVGLNRDSMSPLFKLWKRHLKFSDQFTQVNYLDRTGSGGIEQIEFSPGEEWILCRMVDNPRHIEVFRWNSQKPSLEKHQTLVMDWRIDDFKFLEEGRFAAITWQQDQKKRNIWLHHVRLHNKTWNCQYISAQQLESYNSRVVHDIIGSHSHPTMAVGPRQTIVLQFLGMAIDRSPVTYFVTWVLGSSGKFEQGPRYEIKTGNYENLQLSRKTGQCVLYRSDGSSGSVISARPDAQGGLIAQTRLIWGNIAGQGDDHRRQCMSVGIPAWSPDGKWLATGERRRGLVVYSRV